MLFLHEPGKIANIKGMLNERNFNKGMLIDEQLMAGVCVHPEHSDQYVAFVIEYMGARTLAYESFYDLTTALAAINAIQRHWTFEAYSTGCKGCQTKGGEGCGVNCQKRLGACATS